MIERREFYSNLLFLGRAVVATEVSAPVVNGGGRFKNCIAECISLDDSGRQRLTITLPNAASIVSMANALARLLSVGDASGK